MDISNYVDKSLNMYNAGFTTKAAQKQALDYLSRAYEKIRDNIGYKILDIRNAKFNIFEEIDPECNRLTDLYYLLPYNLCHYRTIKHGEQLIDMFPEMVAQMEYLFELYTTIKSADIHKVAPKICNQEEVIRIEKTLSEIFAASKESFDRTMRLAELFKGVPVSVTPHMVWMNNGTRYVRYFYYVAGKMTALNTIIAAMETYEREQEKVN